MINHDSHCILPFSIFLCHVDFTNSIRCQHLVITEIICTIFDLCHKSLSNKYVIFSFFCFSKIDIQYKYVHKLTPKLCIKNLGSNSRLIHQDLQGIHSKHLTNLNIWSDFVCAKLFKTSLIFVLLFRYEIWPSLPC